MVPGLQFLEAPERFLPVRTAALRERMLGDARLEAADRAQLSKLLEMIAARFHFEFHEKLERLKTLYDPFDPDCDTLPAAGLPTDREARRDEFTQAVEQLLLKANYSELSRDEIIACAEYQARSGLVVRANLSDYAHLRVFYRGIRHETRPVRRWPMPWRREDIRSHVFARVAVVVRLARDPGGPVFLKLFKDVVAEELEMLLPYVRIRMRLLDHLKIGSSVAGGVATGAWKVFTATILSPWLFLLVMSGFAVAAIRGVFSFLSSRTKYMHALSSSLYFQNLANNASALAYLVDAAEAEECKEMLLAYYMLYVERQRDFTQQELDRRVEQWLRTEFDLKVDFEVSDAVRKLTEKGLLVRRQRAGGVPGGPPDGSPGGPFGDDAVLKVYDLPSALRRLDAAWDEVYSYNGVRAPDQDRLADTGSGNVAAG